jgi:hypothetical protein
MPIAADPAEATVLALGGVCTGSIAGIVADNASGAVTDNSWPSRPVAPW